MLKHLVRLCLFASLLSVVGCYTPQRQVTERIVANKKRMELNAAIAALSTADPNRRAAACLRLGMYPDAAEEVIPHLVRMLSDQTPVPMDMNSEWGKTVDSYAIEALTVLGRGRVHLLTPYTDTEDAMVRSRLGIVFIGIGDEDAIEQLLVMLNDPDRATRGNAVSALGDLQVRRAIPAFRDMLKSEDTGVSYSAVLSLAKMGEEGLNAIRTSRPHLSGDALELADRLLNEAE